MDGYRTIAFTGHGLNRFHGSQWLWLVTETRLVLLDLAMSVAITATDNHLSYVPSQH